MSQKRNKNPNYPNLDLGRQTDDYKPEYCELLIKTMKQGYSLASFAGDIGKSRDTVYNWMKKYPEFKEAHQVGKQLALKFFETMLINCTMGIIPEQLKQLGSKKIDVTAVIFALKTRFHKDYGETQKIDHSSSDGSLRLEFVDAKKDE